MCQSGFGQEAQSYPGGYAGMGATGLAGVSDLMGTIARYQQAQEQAKRNRLLTDPNRLAEYSRKLYTPATDAERQAVARDQSAALAGAGRIAGGDPMQALTDAFAKFESGRYNEASGTALRALTGAPGEAAPAGAQLPGILQALSILKALRGGGPQGPAPGFSSTSLDNPAYANYRVGEYQPDTSLQAGADLAL